MLRMIMIAAVEDGDDVTMTIRSFKYFSSQFVPVRLVQWTYTTASKLHTLVLNVRQSTKLNLDLVFVPPFKDCDPQPKELSVIKRSYPSFIESDDRLLIY